jgi:HTH-type transcriptional repressor of NAD biosynthesis genes
MTALPPTKGHLRLLQFSSQTAQSVIAIVCTQPGEPFVPQRVEALRESAPSNVRVYNLHKTIEQNPEAPGFWDMWKQILITYETYGKTLAEKVGGVFIPYDIDRVLYPCKAQNAREWPFLYFDKVAPRFQRYLRKTVTVFGAESTGKTTLSKALAKDVLGHWTYEWARPYLEALDDPAITTEAMEAIWLGQASLQRHVRRDFVDKPFIIQDTDLFSTVGYWDFWNGQTPKNLVSEAGFLKSDLYLITQSNIPFEPDPLRYGGDKRESDDQFWIDLCEKHELNYKVIQSTDPIDRLDEASDACLEVFYKTADKLKYQRTFND